MAVTYKYQQNFYGGASSGYVKYNIAPDIYATRLADGETFTVTGQAYDSTAKPVSVSLECVFPDYPGEAPELGRVSVSANRGAAFTFTVRCTLRRPSDASSRLFSFVPGFTVWGSGGGTSTVSGTVARGLTHRVSPVITALALEDTNETALSMGTLVQKHSVLRCASAVRTDPLDTTTAVKNRTLTIGGKTWRVEGDSAILPESSDFAGDTEYELAVTDTRGLTAVSRGMLHFAPYTPPRVADFSIERCAAETLDSGETVYALDDESPFVWLNLEADVTGINGRNSFTAVISAENLSFTVAAGQDGGRILLEHCRDAVTGEFSVSREWLFTLALADRFESVSYQCRIAASGAIFNIERTGAAVGMRSTGKESNPLFEVAYPAVFYAGLFDGEGNELGANSYSSGERLIGSWFGKPLYRKVREVYSLSTSAADPSRIDMGIRPSRVVNICGFVKTNSYGDIPVNCYHSSAIRAFARPDGLTGSIVAYAGTGCSNSGAVFIVDYTKT